MPHYFVKDFADGFIHFDRWEDAQREAEATGALLLVAFEPERTVRHVKRGSFYNVLGEGEVQISFGNIRTLYEGDELTVYHDAAGKLWLRFPDEFNDGRFKDLNNATKGRVEKLE